MKRILFFVLLTSLLLASCGNGEPEKNDSINSGSNENANTFTVTWKNYDGSILEFDENVQSGSIPSYDGYIPTKPSSENYEYTFSNWSPNLKTVVENVTYIAEFKNTLRAAYVTFDLNGGTTLSDSRGRYLSSIDNKYFFFDVTKTKYIFRGWEYNGVKIFDENGNKVADVDLEETMTFKAVYSSGRYITLLSNDIEGGSVFGGGECANYEGVEINAIANKDYAFIGWYDENDYLVTEEASTTYFAANSDCVLYAKFIKNGTVFTKNSKKFIYFGNYPQTIMQDEDIKNNLMKLETVNDRGYYEYNGNEYAKVYASKCSYDFDSIYYYSNGAKVTQNFEFFKVEPILWRVLACDFSNSYTLLADQAIDTDCFDIFFNIYSKSYIRYLINENFYNAAFNEHEKNSILTTNVDNSSESTSSPTYNKYACENTDDKVFLLSYKDYHNKDYGFHFADINDAARECTATDYAIANKCYLLFKNCYYWTRSPAPDNMCNALIVNDDGGFYSYDVSSGYCFGIRPALRISV